MDDMKYIREQYGVPAKIGMKVVAQGRDGTIVGARCEYIRVKIDGEKNVLLFHPTWEMEYIEVI